MDISILFSKATYKTLSHNLIAALLYDVGKEEFAKTEQQLIEHLFYASLSEGAKNILKSKRTLTKMLRKLQQNSLAEGIERFRTEGQPIAGDHFEKQFSRIISKRNARIIVPLFLESFTKQLLEKPRLLEMLLPRYRRALRNGPWEFTDGFLAEIEVFANKTNGVYENQSVAVKLSQFPRSGQLEPWKENDYVFPVRGLRKIESYLSENPFLHITGNRGSGKSLLISAYITSLIEKQSLNPEEIFYYRFVEGVSGYRSFSEALSSFLKKNQFTDVAEETLANQLPFFVGQSKAIYVIDDIHTVKNNALLRLIEQIWLTTCRQESFSGRLIVLGREKLESLQVQNSCHYWVKGLSVAESGALLRDKWALQLPGTSLRQLSKKLLGNPQFMKLFRNWWLSESHTDTELERFVENMPMSEIDMRDYLCEHLYEVLERGDSRLNNFLESVSPLRVPEIEEFFTGMYEKMGGATPQNRFEDLVERYQMLTYHVNLLRYEVPDLIREFYYERAAKSQMKRVLHLHAAGLYETRFQKNNDPLDAIEGAYHYIRAERAEKSAAFLESFVDIVKVDRGYSNAILEILSELDFDLQNNRRFKMNILYTRGELYLETGSLELAEQDFRECQLLEPPEDLQGNLLYSLGVIAQKRNDKTQAQELFTKALEIYERTSHREGMLAICYQLSETFLEQGDAPEAIEYIRKALATAADIGDQSMILHGYQKLGRLFSDKGEWDQALEHYQTALNTAEDLDKFEVALQLLEKIAIVQKNRGDREMVVETYYRQVDLAEKIGHWRTLANTYMKLGNIFQKEEDLEKALEYYWASEEIYDQKKDRSGLAAIYNHVGDGYRHQNELSTAFQYYQRALSIYREINDSQGILKSYLNLGLIHHAQKKWDEALNIYWEALNLEAAVNNSRGIANIYQQIGEIYHNRGEQSLAIEVYQKCLSLKEAAEDLEGLPGIHYQIGSILKEEGKFRKALKHLERSLELYQQVSDHEGIARTCQMIAVNYQALEEWDRAISSYQQALGAFEEAEDSAGLAQTLYSLGNINHDRGQWEGAIKEYQAALMIFEKIGDLTNIAQTLGNISSLEFEQGNHTGAIQRQVEILLYFQEVNKTDYVERVLSNLVSCHEALGQETFKPLLDAALQTLAEHGVKWGQHTVLMPEKAASMIESIFRA